MEKSKEQEQQQNRNADQQSINQGEQRAGRAGHNETHDISHMDRQEGTMNNGTLGGNFSNDAEESDGRAQNK